MGWRIVRASCREFRRIRAPTSGVHCHPLDPRLASHFCREYEHFESLAATGVAVVNECRDKTPESKYDA
jgi:hypothetical protein